MAEIRPIKFSNELQSQLFPDNEFYKKSIAETGIGIDVETVQIPQAANVGAVGVGVPGALPLTISERTDDIKSYSVQQLYMEEPYLITDENEIVTNYNKRADIITAMAGAINSKAGDIAATEWGPSLFSGGKIVRTSDTATRPVDIVGATGTRNRISYDDLVALRGIINKQNAPVGKWYGLLTPAMVDDLFLLDKLTDADKTQLAMIRTGQWGMIFGITFLMRWNNTLGTNGVLYDTTGNKKALGAAVVATDCAAAIVWHERLVRHAEGHAKTYIDRDKPEYLGTVVNSKVRFGATFNRSDEVGIAAIVETVAT